MLSRARSLWRRARTAPMLGSVLASADRLWWARTIRRAGIVDLDTVAAQVGHRISPRRAVRRYVNGGFRNGFSLNPLFMERTVSRQLSDADRVPALYAYLVNDRSRLDVSPHWDATRLASVEPRSLEDPAGPLGYAWRRALREGRIELGRGPVTVTVPWREIIDAVRAGLPTRPRPATGDPLFICVLGADEADPGGVLWMAAEMVASPGMDVDLVLTAPSFDIASQAALLGLYVPMVRARVGDPSAEARPPRLPRPAMTVFRGPNAELELSGARALAVAAGSGPVAGLWLAPDGTIASAGIVAHDGAAAALLAGHPVADAARLGDAFDVPMLAGPARAWPAGRSADGPGRTLTGVRVRAPRDAIPPDAHPRANTDMDAILRSTGFAVAGGPPGAPVLRRLDRLDGVRRATRWAIKTAAPAGPSGEAWGDTHFARGLAAALERQGQHVSVDAFAAAGRQTSRFDDVTLVLRGPHRIAPPRTGHRILWIISHPDEITADEIDDFDTVFAASSRWARAATSRFGRPILPLLQCTDTTRFHPTGARRTDDIVFVGTARGIARPVVVAPLAAGFPVQVYGPDWTGYIPAAAIVAAGVPNESVPALYESAGVVLNDHWPAMRREGFISNRLYDVVAAGGRAISDDVEGIEEVFRGAVRTFQTPQQLLTLLAGDLDAQFPSPARLARVGAEIRERDSFDARARRLLELTTPQS